MAQVKTNVMRALEKAGIRYTAHFYDAGDGRIDGASVAEKTGQNPRQVFKTLVAQAPSQSCYVFVIPVEQELDLKRCARAVGEKSIELLPVKQLNQVTGYLRGGCSPIGMKKRFPTVLDSSAQGQQTILVSAGKIGVQVELAPQDLAALVQGVFAPVTG